MTSVRTDAGAFRLAGLQPRRGQITELIEWYEGQLTRLGVKVLVNHPVDGHDAAAFGADEIVVATGSQPSGTGFQRFLPAADVMPGADRADACSIEDVLSHNQRPKIDEYPDYLFLVLHIPVFNHHAGRLGAGELDLVENGNISRIYPRTVGRSV